MSPANLAFIFVFLTSLLTTVDSNYAAGNDSSTYVSNTSFPDISNIPSPQIHLYEKNNISHDQFSQHKKLHELVKFLFGQKHPKKNVSEEEALDIIKSIFGASLIHEMQMKLAMQNKSIGLNDTNGTRPKEDPYKHIADIDQLYKNKKNDFLNLNHEFGKLPFALMLGKTENENAAQNEKLDFISKKNQAGKKQGIQVGMREDEHTILSEPSVELIEALSKQKVEDEIEDLCIKPGSIMNCDSKIPQEFFNLNLIYARKEDCQSVNVYRECIDEMVNDCSDSLRDMLRKILYSRVKVKRGLCDIADMDDPLPESDKIDVKEQLQSSIDLVLEKPCRTSLKPVVGYCNEQFQRRVYQFFEALYEYEKPNVDMNTIFLCCSRIEYSHCLKVITTMKCGEPDGDRIFSIFEYLRHDSIAPTCLNLTLEDEQCQEALMQSSAGTIISSLKLSLVLICLAFSFLLV